MSETTKTSNGKNKRLSTLTTFRDGYEHYDLWSYAEAGDFAGVSPYTIRLWADEGKLLLSPLNTPYRVIATVFKAFLITGKVEENASNMQSTT